MYNLVGFLKGLLIQNEVDPTKQLIIQISPSATTGTTTTVTAAQTANRNITLPDSDSQLVGDASTQTLTNKTIDASANTLLNIPLSDLLVVPGDANKFLVRDGSGNVISNTKVVPTGVVVGTSDSQTLTNKTIVAGSNTISGLTNANLSGSAAISNANLATMVNNTVKGNLSGITATPSDLPATSFSQVGAIPVRDSHANLFANNFVPGLAATSNSGGTTTLTVDSAYTQIFFGSGNQTVQLPAANTLTSHQFYISNESSGNVTVHDGGGGTIQTMAANSHSLVTVTNTGSVAGVWDVQYVANTSLSNPMTTGGDIIYGGSGGTPLALHNGILGQYLRSGGGTVAPTWATAEVLQKQIFTSSGTFTIPTGTLSTTAFKFTIVGGGGGGGAGDASKGGGGGGGAGGTSYKWLTGLTAGNTITVTVGFGGGSSGAGSDGNNGGASSISSGTQSITTVTANSGGGGLGGGRGAAPQRGGSAPNGSNGDTNEPGGGGHPSVFIAAGNNFGGNGGASSQGGGGRGGDNSNSSSGDGESGAYGAGGGGGGSNVSTRNGGGSAANSGKIIVEWVL